jgi:hypothetical protein
MGPCDVCYLQSKIQARKSGVISFKTFLNENQEQVFDFKEGLSAIRDNCSWFINESEGKPMMRGIRAIRIVDRKVIDVNTTRISWAPHPFDRKPKDSDPALDFMLNSMIDAAFGIENIRRKSFFATGNRAQARTYGKTMFCFPKGKAKWMWSPDISDAFEDTPEMYEMVNKACHMTGVHSRKFEEIFHELFQQYRFNTRMWVKDQSGSAATVTNNVIESVGLDGISAFENAPAYKVLIDGLRSTAEDLYIDTRNLADAITSGNEIMFYESGGYYLVPEETVAEEAERDGADVKNSVDVDSTQKVYEYLLTKLR